MWHQYCIGGIICVLLNKRPPAFSKCRCYVLRTLGDRGSMVPTRCLYCVLGSTLHRFPFQVTGIFFESKVDYTTWFGANIEYIHGIQVIAYSSRKDIHVILHTRRNKHVAGFGAIRPLGVAGPARLVSGAGEVDLDWFPEATGRKRVS